MLLSTNPTIICYCSCRSSDTHLTKTQLA